MTFDREAFLREAGTSGAELEGVRAYVAYVRSLRRGDVRRSVCRPGMFEHFDGFCWAVVEDGRYPGTPFPIDERDCRPAPPLTAPAAAGGGVRQEERTTR